MASGNTWIGSNAAIPATHTHFDLRPLSTGEILDRTFQLYRARFTLFAGLAMLPAAVSVITQAFRLWYTARESVHVHIGHDLNKVRIVTGSLLLASSLISFVLYGITQAATTWAVSAVYLGEPASIRTAYKAVGTNWFRYTLIVLRQIWAWLWLPFLLIATAFGFMTARRGSTSANLTGAFLILIAFFSLIYSAWAYIRVSLAVPAAVIESLKVRASIKRSKQLLVDRKVRILLLLLFLFALYIVIGTIQAPLAFFALRERGAEAFLTHAISLGLSFVTATLIGPVGAIAICLFYFDERVRREGFDIEWMMTKLAPAQTFAPAVGSDLAASLLPPSEENSMPDQNP
ncbi:MAG TPA: hypothetical protein VHT28_16275 [Silvibacterium sp.]|jgi:hypothetical protein|nr:hypothetical protein [Silvibacterium sp.]